jgi:hypothetical protein
VIVELAEGLGGSWTWRIWYVEETGVVLTYTAETILMGESFL